MQLWLGKQFGTAALGVVITSRLSLLSPDYTDWISTLVSRLVLFACVKYRALVRVCVCVIRTRETSSLACFPSLLTENYSVSLVFHVTKLAGKSRRLYNRKNRAKYHLGSNSNFLYYFRHYLIEFANAIVTEFI